MPYLVPPRGPLTPSRWNAPSPTSWRSRPTAGPPPPAAEADPELAFLMLRLTEDPVRPATTVPESEDPTAGSFVLKQVGDVLLSALRDWTRDSPSTATIGLVRFATYVLADQDERGDVAATWNGCATSTRRWPAPGADGGQPRWMATMSWSVSSWVRAASSLVTHAKIPRVDVVAVQVRLTGGGVLPAGSDEPLDVLAELGGAAPAVPDAVAAAALFRQEGQRAVGGADPEQASLLVDDQGAEGVAAAQTQRRVGAVGPVVGLAADGPEVVRHHRQPELRVPRGLVADTPVAAHCRRAGGVVPDAPVEQVRDLRAVMNARRHARDYERLVQHSETLITWAAITLITRRLTRAPARARPAAVTPLPTGSQGEPRAA